MKLLSSTFAKRNTAFLVLLVWVFALASGVANACLLEAREPVAHRPVAGTLEKVHVPAVLDDQPSMVIHHGEDTHTSKAPCLKACDDGSQALQKTYVETDPIHPGPASIVATLWGGATPALPSIGPTDDPPPPLAESSLRIRYSRWAL